MKEEEARSVAMRPCCHPAQNVNIQLQRSGTHQLVIRHTARPFLTRWAVKIACESEHVGGYFATCALSEENVKAFRCSLQHGEGVERGQECRNFSGGCRSEQSSWRIPHGEDWSSLAGGFRWSSCGSGAGIKSSIAQGGGAGASNSSRTVESFVQVHDSARLHLPVLLGSSAGCYHHPLW